MNYLIVFFVIVTVMFFILTEIITNVSSNTFNNIRACLEIMYFLSGLALAGIGLIALKQITIAKEDITIRSKREALTLTMNQCDNYNKIITAINDIDAKFNAVGITAYKGEIDDAKGLDIWISKHKEKLLSDSDRYNESLLGYLVNTSNSLEVFALSFIQGICDETVAYPLVGKNFCRITRELMPAIHVLREGNSGCYSNIIQLYNIWGNRNRKSEAELKAIRALNAYRANSAIAATIEEKTITPVGTK